MKTTTVLILATLVLFAFVLANILTGCGGGDTNHCMATSNCPADIDANPMTADANPTATPDANLTPDATTDPCAAYVGHTDGWTCDPPASPGFSCDFTLSVKNGQCFITCPGEFECTTPAPNEMSTNKPFSCVEFGGSTMMCYP